MGVMPCSLNAAVCAPKSRRARSAAWIVGCRVFTRPSRTSGNPVTFSTSTTGTLAARRVAAVPPVEMISQPSSTSDWQKATTPRLSLTEIRALGIDSGPVTGRLGTRGRLGPSRRGVCQRYRVSGRSGRKHDARKQPVLRVEYTAGELLRSIAVQHGNSCLRQYSTVIIDLIDEVNGDSRFCRATGEHRLVHAGTVHAFATEVRKQCRVGVDDASAICSHNARGYQLEVTCEDDEIDALLVQETQPLISIVGVRQNLDANAAVATMVEPGCFSFITENENDLRTRSRPQLLQELLQIATASGYGNGYAHRHGAGR